MTLVWRGKKPFTLKNPRKSALKHPVQLSRNLTLYLTDEGLEQLQVANWLRFHNIMFLHIPNESRRHKLEGITLRLLGLTSGAFDILIFDTPPNYPDKKGFALEMKAKKGAKPTDNQVNWQSQITKRDWLTAICYGAEEAIKVLEDAGYGQSNPKI